MDSAPHGTVTFLFTDLADSTSLFDRMGDDRAEAVRRSHFRLLREAVVRTGGTEVKSLGDGLMVAFSSAVSAVDAAVDIQRTVELHNRRNPDSAVGVRVGLHVGEPIRDEDDYFGTAVIVARRLCDAADAGHVIASQLVADLVGSRGDHDFLPLADLQLKGLSRPVRACEVAWQDRPESLLPVPSALVAGDRPLIGRLTEMATAAAAWTRAESGGREVLLIAGEPGIGKTRLSAELASTAHAAGGIVLYGACAEESVVPYQPFVEALRGLARQMPAGALMGHIETASAILGRLVPELHVPAAESEPEDGSDPETERYLLFESVTEILAGVAAEAPTLLVLDDVHWADRPTLLILRHLLRSPDWRSMLIVGTYRDTDLSRTHPLAEMLADLRRARVGTRIALRGLDADAVRELIASAAGHSVRADFAAAVHRETEGNPFFVEETIRHLVDSGVVFQRDGRWTFDVPVEEMGIPEGVRDVIGRRLSRLSPICNRVLVHAAILGRTFEFDVLRRLCREDDEELVSAIEQAVEHHVLEDVTGVYTFTHALIRQTLYEEATLPRKQRLHLRAAEAIEAVHARDLGQYLGAVALHYRQAGAAADWHVAANYAVRAAAAATVIAGWEEAIDHLRAAIEITEDGGGESTELARLHERLGNLLIITAVDHADGVAHLERAIAIAAAAGDEIRAAVTRSRLGVDLIFYPANMNVRRALEHLGAAETVLAARQPGSRPLGYTLMGLAFAALWSNDSEAADATERALALARQLGDDRLLAASGAARTWALGRLCRIREAVVLVEEMWSVAERQADIASVFTIGWTAIAIDGVLLDDYKQAAMWIERVLAHPAMRGAIGQRRLILELDAARSVYCGDLDTARGFLGEPGPFHYGHAAALYECYAGESAHAIDILGTLAQRRSEIGDAWDTSYYAMYSGKLQRAVGDPAAAATTLRHMIMTAPPIIRLPALCDLALVALDSGRLAEARAAVETARSLVPSGEDLRGRAMDLLCADAAVGAAEGRSTDAPFADALEGMRRWGRVWDEAEVLLLWGRADAQRGETEAARQRISAALAAYSRAGAGSVWTDRAARELELLAHA